MRDLPCLRPPFLSLCEILGILSGLVPANLVTAAAFCSDDLTLCAVLGLTHANITGCRQ